MGREKERKLEVRPLGCRGLRFGVILKMEDWSNKLNTGKRLLIYEIIS